MGSSEPPIKRAQPRKTLPFNSWWRVCKRAHADLSGRGGELKSGRWHTARPGSRVLYASAHPSTALLESLVQLIGRTDDIPPSLVLVNIQIRADEAMDHVSASALGDAWSADVYGTRAYGDAWLRRGASVGLLVPCALSPSPPALNVLINPAVATPANMSIGEVLEIAPKIQQALGALAKR